MSLPGRGADGQARATSRFHLWDVPTSIWAYGFLRAVAFGVPLAIGYGGVGLGVVITLILYVFLVRGSRVAWSILLVLDVLTLTLLIATQAATQAPYLMHICTGAALVALLMPSARSYVATPRPARPRN